VYIKKFVLINKKNIILKKKLSITILKIVVKNIKSIKGAPS
jgi:hypothetical protein